MDPPLFDLLDRLAAEKPPDGLTWNGWKIRPVAGGGNGLLYRITGAPGDFAVEVTPRDERKGAERAFNCLTFLHDLRLAIAPTPIYLATSSR